MQLNTLNSIRKRTVLNQLTLPKIGHRILHFYDHLFVFGGSRFQMNFNPIIHRLNTQTNQIQTLQISKLPHLEGFALFQYGEFIYLWGGVTPNRQNLNSQLMSNSLLQFDGSKCISISQSGQIPSPRSFFAYTLFLNRYLIICGGFDCQVFYNTWHIMDLKDFSWKKIKVFPEMPYSYRSTMKWSNGRGYILLQQAYFQKNDQFNPNLFYEFKFSNFKKLQLKISKIEFSSEIINLNVQLSNLCFIENNSVLLLGGQKKFMKKHFSYHKNAVIYNYETLQWQLFSIDFQGSQFQSLYHKGKLFIVGGIRSQTQIFPIQILELNKNSTQSDYKRQLQNAQCYYCETIYSYKQNHSNFIVKCQFQPVALKNKVQNKFLWKFSQIFRSPFQAIGSLLDWFINMKCQGIQISLRNSYIQKINPELAKKIYNASDNQNLQIFNFLKIKCYNQQQDVLSFQNIQNCLLKQTDYHICSSNFRYFENQSQKDNQQLSFLEEQISQFNNTGKFKCFFQLKLLCFRLGYSFLFVTLTKQNFITISYISCVQTQSPEMIHKKTSLLSYTISWSKLSNQFSYSSQVNRHIIFQNVRHCFQDKQAYQQTFSYFNTQNKKSYFHNRKMMPLSLYIFDCRQLQKSQTYSFTNIVDNQEKSKREYTFEQNLIQNYKKNNWYKYSDIVLKAVSKSNPQNSLLKYLQALYLPSKNQTKIICENNIVINNQSPIEKQQVQYSPIQQFFKQAEQQEKIKVIKLSHPKQRSAKLKNQQQQTHFTTMQDQNQIPIQNLDIFKSWSLYLNVSFNQEYKGIFFYMNKRLVFVHKNSKFSCVQGIIQLTNCKQDKRTQLLLNKCQFSSLETQQLIRKWLCSLEGFIMERRMSQLKMPNQIQMVD